MTRIGYARVSTAEQDATLQLGALWGAGGCDRVYNEQASGARADRPERARVIDYAREGDTVVVWKLDRWGRSVADVVATVTELRDRGVQFVSLTEGFDTTTPAGELMFHMLAALAQFERSLIRERTMAGLASARINGRKGGRPRRLTPEQVAMIRREHQAWLASEGAEGSTVSDLRRAFGVGQATIYRALHAQDTADQGLVARLSSGEPSGHSGPGSAE